MSAMAKAMEGLMAEAVPGFAEFSAEMDRKHGRAPASLATARRSVQERCRYLDGEYVRICRMLAAKLDAEASRVEAETTAKVRPNDLGIVRGSGVRIDALCAEITAYRELLDWFDEIEAHRVGEVL